MDLRGNIRWVSLTFDYTTDLVGEDSWKWTMAGSKKNCIRATKGKCDVKNQLALGYIDFLQHPSSITGSSQAGVGDPRPFRNGKTVQDLIGLVSVHHRAAGLNLLADM